MSEETFKIIAIVGRERAWSSGPFFNIRYQKKLTNIDWRLNVYEEKIPLHKTETIPIDAQAGNEWELVCSECSFRARFTQQGANRLEILDLGNPQARHAGNQGSATTINPDHYPAGRRGDNEETWLTPELRQRLSEILQGLD